MKVQGRKPLWVIGGNDPGCTNYLDAYREGKLEAHPA